MLKRTLLICAVLAHVLTTNAQLNLLSNFNYAQSRGDCSDIWGHVDQAGNEYAIVGNNNGTSIMDVTDPTNPVEVFFSAGPTSTWRDIKVWQDVAYITNETSGGLKIIDMSNLPGPINGADVSTYGGSVYPFNSAHDFFVDENGKGYVLGADNGEGGAIILDLVNPLFPIELGRYNDYYLHDAFVRGDTLWGGAVNDGFFVVVDVSNSAAPITMATQLTPNTFTHNCWLSDDGNYLFTTDEVSGAYVASYDVSNISNIIPLDQVQSNPGSGVIPHNTFVVAKPAGNFIVTSYYRDGVTIHDVTNPSNLIEVANYDTSPSSGDGFNGLWGVYPYLPSGNIIGSDIESGLYVWGTSYIAAAYLEGNITDIVTTNAISNAQIDVVSTTNSDLSDGLGDYATGTATGGTYTVTVSRTGYLSETINNVVLTNGATTILDVELEPLATYTLLGSVVNSNLDPVVNAQVKISNGTTTTTVTTNGIGEFDVPGFLEGVYDVYIGKWGYHSFCALNENLLISNNPHLYQIDMGYSDDFALDLGWTSSSTASTGAWERDVPVGTTLGGNPSNPGADASGDCGEEAYITGNAGGNAGSDDVDGGEVTLFSPLFDLSAYSDPYIEFERWFFNSGGSGPANDSLVIALSNGTTTAIIDFAVANDPNAGSWAPKSIRVTDFLSPTSFMQIQVRAMDIPTGHISEGGFDKFMVRDSLSTNVDGITTGNGIQPASWCEGNTVTLQVDFTSTGTFTAGNTYTAELSDATGSFAAPTIIGTLPSTANSGMVSSIVPGSTPSGSGYRIRVVSDSPVTIGVDNGVDLTIGTPPTVGLGVLADACETAPFYTLTAGSPSGGTYTGPGITGGVFDPAVAGAGTHNVTYFFTDGNGCSGEASGSIIVNPSPSVSFLALDDVCDYTAAFPVSGGLPIGGVYSGPGIVGLTFDPSVAGIGSHILSYTYTDMVTGCIGEEVQTIIVDGCLSIDEKGLENMVLYPNPVSESFQLISDNVIESVQVLEMSGRIVKSFGAAQLSYDISAIPSGIYMVTVQTADHIGQLRIIVK